MKVLRSSLTVTTITIAASIAATGCVTILLKQRHGTAPDEFAAAQQVRGVTVQVRLLSAEAEGLVPQGELLEVSQSRLLLLTDSQVIGLPANDINTHQSRILARTGKWERWPSGDQLRLLARFPDGLSPELLRRLLDAHGQTDVLRVGQ